MKKYFPDITLFFILTCISGCSIVGGIFKAGMGFGIFLVVVVVALVIWLISRAGRK
jgi:hypothetical protein